MSKRILQMAALLLISCALCIAGDWVPVMYNTNTKVIAFGGTTNAPSTNTYFGTLTVGTGTFVSVTATNIYRNNPDDTYQDNECISYRDFKVFLQAFSVGGLYGTTNLHPVSGFNTYAMHFTNVVYSWAVTNALAVGTNYIGTWYYTNAVSSYIPHGLYYGYLWSYKTGAGNPTVQTYFELVTSDSVTTNTIAVSEKGTLGTVLAEQNLYVSVTTNWYVPTTSNYLGISVYEVRAGGATANSIIEGGDGLITVLRYPYLVP